MRISIHLLLPVLCVAAAVHPHLHADTFIVSTNGDSAYSPLTVTAGGNVAGGHGKPVAAKFTIQNTGQTADHYSLTASDSRDWDIELQQFVLNLEVGADTSVTVTITSPTQAGPMLSDTLRFEAISLLTGYSGADTLTVSVGTRGDIDGDGHINVLEVLWVANFILSLTMCTQYECWAADCSGDNCINILDALNIARVILGIIPACHE